MCPPPLQLSAMSGPGDVASPSRVIRIANLSVLARRAAVASPCASPATRWSECPRAARSQWAPPVQGASGSARGISCNAGGQQRHPSASGSFSARSVQASTFSRALASLPVPFPRYQNQVPTSALNPTRVRVLRRGCSAAARATMGIAAAPPGRGDRRRGSLRPPAPTVARHLATSSKRPLPPGRPPARAAGGGVHQLRRSRPRARRVRHPSAGLRLGVNQQLGSEGTAGHLSFGASPAPHPRAVKS